MSQLHAPLALSSRFTPARTHPASIPLITDAPINGHNDRMHKYPRMLLLYEIDKRVHAVRVCRVAEPVPEDEGARGRRRGYERVLLLGLEVERGSGRQAQEGEVGEHRADDTDAEMQGGRR